MEDYLTNIWKAQEWGGTTSTTELGAHRADLHPTSKLATLNWFADTTLGSDLGPVSADDLYSAMDWLLEQQPACSPATPRTRHASKNSSPAPTSAQNTRNPALAAKRAHKRTSLLEATGEQLETISKAVEARRLKGAGKIGVKVGKTVGKYNMAKHFDLGITEEKFTYERNAESIRREAELDGIYVIRTNVPDTNMDAPEAVRTYKSLANVEKIFKTLKSRDLGIRPIRHYTENRTRAHVFLCMLAAHLTWHLRTAWAPLTFTDEERPVPEPVAKVARSAGAARKASTGKLDDGSTATSYQDLLAHLGVNGQEFLPNGGQ